MRRNFTKEFKASIVEEFNKGDISKNALAKKHNIAHAQVSKWIKVAKKVDKPSNPIPPQRPIKVRFQPPSMTLEKMKLQMEGLRVENSALKILLEKAWKSNPGVHLNA